MESNHRSKEKRALIFFFLYFSPIILLSAFHAFISSSSPLIFFSGGLLLSATAAIFLSIFLKEEIPNLSLPFLPEQTESKTESAELSFAEENRQLKEALLLKDKTAQTALEELRSENQSQADLITKLSQERKTQEEIFQDYQGQLEELRQTAKQQRDSLENKQQHIQDLETKILDLSYEIKTLLQLTEIPNTPSVAHEEVLKEELASPEDDELREIHVKTEDQASLLLKRCLDIAQKITSANPFSQTSPRFRDFPFQNSTLDLRRLIDALKSEEGAGIFLYSQKENKLLFVNSQVKLLLDWSPEKFQHHFMEIFQESQELWKDALTSLNTSKECHVELSLKTRAGTSLPVQLCLGKIFTGVFRNHIIGIFYVPSAKLTQEKTVLSFT